MRRALPQGVLTAFLFAFLYNVSFLAAPALTTGRVALLTLLLLYLGALRKAWERMLDSGRVLVACLVLVTIYALAQFTLESGGDATQLSRLLNFAVYVLLGASLFTVASGYDLRRFLSATALATGVQACFIAISFVSPWYRAAIAELLVQGGSIPLTNALQVPGFSNSAGALLSLIQALGVLASLLSARLAPPGRERRRYLLLAVASALSTIVVGRTGLQFSLVLFVGYAALGGPAFMARSLAVVAALTVFVAATGGWVLEQASARNPEAAATVAWAFEFFVTGTRGTFFQEFAGQSVPPISVETVIGTGRVTSVDGISNASGSDSGYVQTYYALGLPAAVIFYGAFFTYVIGAFARVRTERVVLGLLIAATMVLEVKEPFIFKYALPFFLLVLLALASRPSDHDTLPETGR